MHKPARFYAALLASLLLVGCGGDDDDDDNDGDSGGTPPPVGQVDQVDRVGRPAVNTALIGSANKDDYNESADPQRWSPQFRAEIRGNLTTFDSLDMINGNALLGDDNALAGVLVDDRLAIDTGSGNCDAYLAVELGVAGDCGGRTLERDVIDDTLGATVGAPVSDNVGNDSAYLDEFPFLGPPIGSQIDRVGRPAVNTALIRSDLKDIYNSSDDPALWAALFGDEVTDNLLVIDGLDGTVGNALLNDSGALAGVLVDDRLVIDTGSGNCDAYLAVELGVAGDCGGRTLQRDVIDDTLGATVGAPVSDNVDDDSAVLAQFPFMAAPN